MAEELSAGGRETAAPVVAYRDVALVSQVFR